MEIEAIGAGQASREAIRALSRRSDVKGAAQLGLHLAVLVLTGALLQMSRGSLWVVPAILAQGIVLVCLFCAAHECIHRTAFASRWINDTVAALCGALLVLPPGYFRAFHLTHHRFTQDPVRDPELAQSPPASRREWLWRCSGLPYWRDAVQVSLRHALGRVAEPFIPAERRAAIVREARLLGCAYLALIIASIHWHRSEALLFWVLPAIAGQPLLRLFLMAEHGGCPRHPDMRINTRSTQTHPAVRLLTWRMSYHAEHHCVPAVPFHALPRLHALLGASLQVHARGYIAVHRELLAGFARGRRVHGEGGGT